MKAGPLNRRHLLQAGAGLCATPAFAQQQPAAADGSAALRARQRPPGVALAAARITPDGARFVFAPAAAGAARAVDADSRFEYGSITKTFTALLLAQHVQRGELALDDAVERALPEGLRLRDSAGAALTWADLATHRSGLPRLPGNLDAARPDPYAAYGEAELKAFLRDWKPTQPRDTRWEYSNLGFGLLGQALAWRANQPFEALLREQVLDPLGLPDVQLARRPVPGLPGLLPGHDAQGRPAPAWHFDALAGAGALVGSARSLARYAQAALGLVATPLQAAFQLALSLRAVGPAPHNRIGLAWLGAPLGTHELRMHDGGTAGHASSLCLEPAARQAALVLANGAGSVNDLALHLLEPTVPVRDIAAEERTLQGPAVELAPEVMAPLAGRYRLNPQFALDLRVRNGRLYAQATGQGEFELFARGPRSFFARVAPIGVTFDGDEGVPAALSLRQGGQTLVFRREP